METWIYDVGRMDKKLELDMVVDGIAKIVHFSLDN